MIYKGYTIARGEVITTKKRRRGTIDVIDSKGEVVNFFTYSVGNSFSRDMAKKDAKIWIDSQE